VEAGCSLVQGEHAAAAAAAAACDCDATGGACVHVGVVVLVECICSTEAGASEAAAKQQRVALLLRTNAKAHLCWQKPLAATPGLLG